MIKKHFKFIGIAAVVCACLFIVYKRMTSEVNDRWNNISYDGEEVSKADGILKSKMETLQPVHLIGSMVTQPLHVIPEIQKASSNDSLVLKKQLEESKTASNIDSSTPRTITDAIYAKLSAERSLDDVLVFGEIKNGTKYAVYSASTNTENSLDYLFPLPLTALAWKRIGFGSIIIIVGESKKWASTALYRHILASVYETGAVLVFLNTAPENEVMIAQVSRLLISHLLGSYYNSTEPFQSAYLIMSDSDLWPLDGNIYNLPENKCILSLNSECCGSFFHTNQKNYHMLPIGNIGMNITMWKQVTRRQGFVPTTTSELLLYFKREFGDIVLQPVQKGDNVGWYLDQRMISIVISDWVEQDMNRQSCIQYVPRSVGVDRVDRSWWSPFSIEKKVDSHILTSAYLPENWSKMRPLVNLMYANNTYHLQFIDNYVHTFQDLYP